MTEVIWDTLLDAARLLPFLFAAYLLMEYLEHRAGEHTDRLIRGAGRLGPVIGAAAGAVPQCGFSAAAANLYTGRVVSLGTLIAIFLSTSDEMLPILISERVSGGLILKILGLKVLIGAAAGLCVDWVVSGRKRELPHIHELCEQEHCHCEKGIVRSAASHTLRIFLFVLLISLGLNLALYLVGEEALGGMILNRPVLGQLLAGLIGLIPNCAASVAITQLYLSGGMSFGAMMSGLLSGAGVGVLILFRVNRDRRENLRIVALLYGIGVLAGLLLEYLPAAG